jgi:lipopolysaccharide biosynthesis glycosyltransferase
VLHKGVSIRNIEKLEEFIGNFKNISLEFIDVSEYFKGTDINVFIHYPIEVYFRLLIPYLLSDYEKVLYLDCDIICLGDISKLFQYNIDNYLMACCRDLGFITQKDKTRYVKKIGLNTNQNYFNGGVLLINTKKFSNEYDINEIFEIICNQKYLLADQDILNILCDGKVLYLHTEWNVMANGIYKKIPKIFRKDYIAAQMDPKIIHFSWYKPWKMNYITERSEYFWKYAKGSAFFYEICNNCNFTKTVMPHDEIFYDILGECHYGLRFIIKCLYLWIMKKLKLYKGGYRLNKSGRYIL